MDATKIKLAGNVVVTARFWVDSVNGIFILTYECYRSKELFLF